MNDAEIRLAILNKLMFSTSISYGELQKVTENHDLFNYHLKELVAKKLVSKNASTYSLTEAGHQQVALMEEDGKYQKQFKVGMFINLFRKEKGKWQMLLYKRLKHPHLGLIGTVTGKLRWGDSLHDNLCRELEEELGVVPTTYEIIGTAREIFRNNDGEKVGDGVFFIFYVTKWTGTPNEKSIEGEYFWHDIDSILGLENIFREGFESGIPHMKQYLDDRENFSPYVVENGEDKLRF